MEKDSTDNSAKWSNLRNRFDIRAPQMEYGAHRCNSVALHFGL